MKFRDDVGAQLMQPCLNAYLWIYYHCSAERNGTDWHPDTTVSPVWQLPSSSSPRQEAALARVNNSAPLCTSLVFELFAFVVDYSEICFYSEKKVFFPQESEFHILRVNHRKLF